MPRLAQAKSNNVGAAADAVAWANGTDGKLRENLSERGLAIATVSKHGKRAKTMFQHAVRDRLLNASPFADMKGASESNSERQHFITKEVTKKVSEACPDIDWDAGRLRIEAVKTELRFLPMFPEIRKALEESWDAAPAVAPIAAPRRNHQGKS